MKVEISRKLALKGIVPAMIFAALVVPISAHSADKLMVQDSGGNIKFSARDDGSIMLNSNTFDTYSWAKIYAAGNNDNVGYEFDSFANDPAKGGGGIFGFARGTQAAKAAVQNGDRVGFFLFSGYDGTKFVNSAGLTAKVDGAVSTSNVPVKIAFESNAGGYPRQERMVISSSGNVGIGVSTPSYPLQMGSGAYVTTGGVWTNASSREYKENIKSLTAQEALDTLGGLNPIKYNYKTDAEDRHVGFIAEDVPELVATRDRKGLSPMDIVAVLTKVVQEQQNMIRELSLKIDKMQQDMNRAKGMNVVGSISRDIAN